MARVGIIGTGWGLMHLGAFRAAGAEVVALCGRDPDKTRSVAEREGVPLGTGDVGELLGAADVVVVASPPDAHGAHAEAALRAGRHVLCEKPLARSALEAESLAALAAESPSVVAAVNFPMRWLGPIAALRGAIVEGRLGALRAVTAVVTHGFGPEPATEDGLSPSAEFGGASHAVDAAFWLAGEEPERVSGEFLGGPGRGIAVLASTRGGCAVSVVFGAGPVPGIWGTWRLIGDEAEASFAAGYVPALGGWAVDPVRVGDEALTERIASDPAIGDVDPWYLSHVYGARAFLAAAESGERAGLPSFADGARVQRVLVAAADSARSGRCAEI